MEGELNSGVIHSKNILKSASINEQGVLPYDGETIKFHDVMTIMADNSLDQIFWQCKKYKHHPLKITALVEKVDVLSILIRSNPFLDVDRLPSIRDLAFGIHYWKKKDSKKSRYVQSSEEQEEPMKLYKFCIYYQSVRSIKLLNHPPFSLCFGLTCHTPHSQRLEDNIIGYQDHNPIIAQAYSLMRTLKGVRYCSCDTMNRLISSLSISETVDEFSSFVEMMLSSPEVSQLSRLCIYRPIPERSLVCFNHVLGKLQNLNSFEVKATLNAMLPAHSTKLWLHYFRSPAPAVWYKLSNLTQLTGLMISVSTLDETDCDQLIQLLGNNPTLEELTITNSRFPNHKIVSLIEIIGNLSRLQRLRLYDLNWEYRLSVWYPLMKLEAIKELTIDQKTVAIDFEYVMNIIQKYSQLNSLDLRRFRLCDCHIKTLMAILKWSPIIILRISLSSFSLKGLYELVHKAERNPKLESVFIRRCLFRGGPFQDADLFEFTVRDADLFKFTVRRPREDIEADKQTAFHISHFCPKIKFSDFI